MGWIFAVNPLVGVFVYEVVEPAGKAPEGKTMRVTGVQRCPDTGWTLHYRVDEVFATEAEAARALEHWRAEWLKQDDERRAARAAARKAAGYAKRIHLPTQRHAWLSDEYFAEASEKGLALCETIKTGSKTLTADRSKITCRNCIRLMLPD
jgi:hypothetical protein